MWTGLASKRVNGSEIADDHLKVGDSIARVLISFEVPVNTKRRIGRLLTLSHFQFAPIQHVNWCSRDTANGRHQALHLFHFRQIASR